MAHLDAKIKKIYKIVKKEKHSKTIKNYKRPVSCKSLKKDK